MGAHLPVISEDPHIKEQSNSERTLPIIKKIFFPGEGKKDKFKSISCWGKDTYQGKIQEKRKISKDRIMGRAEKSGGGGMKVNLLFTLKGKKKVKRKKRTFWLATGQ